MMTARNVAWIRYGMPITREQIDFAVDHYSVAILQPWEQDAAEQLKRRRPDMTVLKYKCLSSTRSNEPGPIVPTGVSYAEAEESGEHWFAHRLDGSRIAWQRYEHHWQMAVWEPEYQQRWVENVVEELDGSVWDGVMADNDVFDDYYGLDCPIEDGRRMSDIRASLGELIARAGKSLNDIDKLLVPNIAESRRTPGRWVEHSSWGGGYEEVWMAWGSRPEDHLEPMAAYQQGLQAQGPGLSILHTVTDGSNDDPNVAYGLAAAWIFGGGRSMYSATGHDAYSGTPWNPLWAVDLGLPVTAIHCRGNGYSREFDHGWTAVNLNDKPRRSVRFPVPKGMVTLDGTSTSSVTLQPHEGILLRRA